MKPEPEKNPQFSRSGSSVPIGPGGFTGPPYRDRGGKHDRAGCRSKALFKVPSAWVAAVSVEADFSTPFGVALASSKADSVLYDLDSMPHGIPKGAGGLVGPAADRESHRARDLRSARRSSSFPKSIQARKRESAWSSEVIDLPRSQCGVLPLGSSPRALEEYPGRTSSSPLYGREAEAVTKWRQLHPDSGDCKSCLRDDSRFTSV